MKLKLDVSEMAEEFFEDSKLLGIVAKVKDYQFCWQLNQRFRFRFRLNNDIEIQLSKKQRNYFFPIYQYPEPNSSLIHYLYNNHHDGEYLLPEFKHLDFLWLVKGDVIDQVALQEIIQSIRSISAVQLVTELTNEKIKHKDHLIF
ncbi:IPExxxVDY family protein [Flavihumibacter rivuli]|uniref:IPExxxVDY family protein n=1 Tax=Flavihumibacter rivuli TaxID=2838156 RepID=UPI001BDEA723|nr:IPExxxVDY family protein [Flavihumibacter rivuli]ULQ55728.1 IPExxxVDY family protein [Flavihumibacter rivuli]